MTIKVSIGTPTANSYISVSSANTYFASLESGAQWDNIVLASTGTLSATNRKENLLKQATREIDRTFRFFGSKYNKGDIGQSTYQKLQFPRDTDYDSSGSLYIQEDIQIATCEQALWIMQRGSQRYDSDGNLVKPDKFSSDAYNYIKSYVNRGIKATGKYEWQ